MHLRRSVVGNSVHQTVNSLKEVLHEVLAVRAHERKLLVSVDGLGP